MTPRPIPLTVIGGYLGAGKTTLVNRLLRSPGGRRLGVIVNDFGTLAIDAALLAGAGSGDVISLPNGCVCCTLGADLHVALRALVEAPGPPDHVVVEASGVADPAVAAAWGTVPPFEPGGVLVLAAADSVRASVHDRYVGGEVVRQLAGADLIVLTRTDRCSDAETAEVGGWLDERFPGVPRIVVTRGEVPADVVLGIRPDGRPDAEAHHAVDDLYRSHEWSSPNPVPASGLHRFLAALGPDVVRAKGLVALDDGTGLEVQVVGRTVHTAAHPAPARSQLVVITRAGPPGEPSDPFALLPPGSA